jgi:hypothetical protein
MAVSKLDAVQRSLCCSRKSLMIPGALPRPDSNENWKRGEVSARANAQQQAGQQEAGKRKESGGLDRHTHAGEI